MRIAADAFASWPVPLLLFFLLVPDFIFRVGLNVEQGLSRGSPYSPSEATNCRFETFFEDLAYGVTDK